MRQNKTLKKTQVSLFLQVLDPYQEQNEEGAVVVLEESGKKIKSAQDMVTEVLLPVRNTL